MTMSQYAELHVDDTSAFLGLEKYLTESGRQDITHRRRTIRRSVLVQQQRQSRLDICDPYAMATIAEANSNFSRRRARIIGLIHTDTMR